MRIAYALLAGLILLSSPMPSEAATLPVGTTLNYNIRDSEKRSGNEFELSPELENVKASKIVFKNGVLSGADYFEVEKTDVTTRDEKVVWTFLLDTENLGLAYLKKKLLNKANVVTSEAWYNYSDTMFNFPKNLCYMYTLPMWLMGKPLQVGDKYDFYILLSYNAAPMHMFAVVTSTAKMTVPAGTFDCYIIKLVPDYQKILGKWSWAKDIITPFVPDYVFWLDKNAPHVMVRFEGKFGPVGGSPTQIYELVSQSKTK